MPNSKRERDPLRTGIFGLVLVICVVLIAFGYKKWPHIMDALLDAMDAPHEGPFRIVLLLPAFAGDGRWDNNKHVQALRNADRQEPAGECCTAGRRYRRTGIASYRDIGRVGGDAAIGAAPGCRLGEPRSTVTN